MTVEVEIDRVVEVIDTGGLGITDEAELDQDIHHQIDTAASADLVLMIVDAKDGLQALDREVAKRLRPLKKPTLLVVNKCEADRDEDMVSEFWALGLEEPIPISAAHGMGVVELLERWWICCLWVVSTVSDRLCGSPSSVVAMRASPLSSMP